MSECNHSHPASSVSQTLDELEFERGIWYAAQHNDISRVQNLLKKADVNIVDKSGYTALHYASRNGHLDMCKLLVGKGANVNALTKLGKVSALQRCASMGYLDVFKFLLQSGASINVSDSDGKTVLHRAVEGKHFDLVDYILHTEPNLQEAVDNKGKTPKDYSYSCQNISSLFK